MAELKYLSDTARQVVINDNAALTNGDWAAGDYDNSTELDIWGYAILIVQFDGGPPSAGARIADLYIIPGDGEGSEVFPQGGDAALGIDVIPQQIWYAGSFETRSPSTTTDEQLFIPVRLYPDGNRFVIVNTSGQSFDLTWELNLKPVKYQSV